MRSMDSPWYQALFELVFAKGSCSSAAWQFARRAHRSSAIIRTDASASTRRWPVPGTCERWKTAAHMHRAVEIRFARKKPSRRCRCLALDLTVQDRAIFGLLTGPALVSVCRRCIRRRPFSPARHGRAVLGPGMGRQSVDSRRIGRPKSVR